MPAGDLESIVFDGLLFAGTTPGVALTQMCCVAIKLNVVELLTEQARDAAALSSELGMHAPSFERFLCALAGCGVLRQREDGVFEPGPLASRLKLGSPESLRAPLVGVADAWKVWGELEDVLRTGKPAFAKVIGEREWDFLKANPNSNSAFTEHMSRLATKKIAAATSYDFQEEGLAIDCGGRDGTLLSAILHRRPKLRGILFDLPEVAPLARERFVAEGLADRCEAVGGSFFESVPTGGDLYILSSVLHDWGDEDSMRILTNVRRAMKPSSRLLLIEVVLPERNQWTNASMLDMNMMVITGGKERTSEDWRSLCERSGFQLAKIVPIGEFAILEASPT